MRPLLVCASLLALLSLALVVSASSSAVHASYQLKSLHTLSRASAGKLQLMQLARLTISADSTLGRDARLSMICGETQFESSSATGRFLVTAGAAAGHPLHAPRAEHSIYSRVQAMTWFEGESAAAAATQQERMEVYVLLHKLPTADDVAEAVAASDDDDTTAAALSTSASVRAGFGGWPQVIRPCSSGQGDDGIQSLDCCKIVVTSASGVEHSASLRPMQPRNMQHTPEQAYSAEATRSQSEPPAARVNASESLLQWKRVLFAVESTTPLFAPSAAPAHLPSHMPPTRAQRREFLSQALRRKEMHIRNHQPTPAGSGSGSRMSATELAAHPDAASVTAFVEQSGWSSTSLADVMAPGVDSGLSPATAEIVAATPSDLEEVGELMQDVTTTFLAASEQVHAHLRAGVSARQVIATICNKLVLKSMPPKVGLAITKSLQQAVLNVMKSSTADQLTQYLVPPSSEGGSEAFMERGAQFKPTSQASMVQDLVAQVAAINPEVARAIAQEEAARQRDVLDRQAQREADRQRRMKLTSLGNVFVELEAQVTPSAPTPAAASAAPKKEDKYASFLATYSAARIRALSKVKGSGGSITEQIQEHLTPQLTNGIVSDASAQLTSSLHTLLHESLSNRLHAGLSKSLTDSLTTSLTASISESQVSLLSVMLRDQLTRESTHILTRSLTLLLTPALSLVLTRSLTRSPQADYYCHLCANPQANFPDKPAEFHLPPPPGANPSTPYCLSCADSKTHDAYMDYYSSYFARYYSTYFSYYYGGAFSKDANDHLLGICLETPAPPQQPPVEPDEPGCLGTGEVASVAGCTPLPPDPEPEPEPEPAPEPTEPPSLKGVNFDNDKSTLRPESFAILDHAIEVLKAKTTGSVLVEGHTDSNASNAYNQGLSERRANTVKQYLEAGGVTVPLSAQGFGEERPIDTNDTPEGRFNNRRVELSFHE